MKRPTQEVLDYLKARALEGGRAVKKKYGREHFVRMGKARTYPPCPNPRRGDASLRHRFNPQTGICYGCKQDRKKLKNSS